MKELGTKLVFIILGLLMAGAIGVSFLLPVFASSNSPISKQECVGMASNLSTGGFGGLSHNMIDLCNRFLK